MKADPKVSKKSALRFAYADPPYPRCARMHYRNDPSGIAAEEVNYVRLIARLMTFDAWAVSTHSPSLRDILPICPVGSRVGVWVKPFAAFKRNVRVAYSWEPVIFFGARGKENKRQLTIHDWVSAIPPIFTRRNLDGTKGQKPMEFCMWLFALMGLRNGDELHDLFPGSGAVGIFWKSYLAQSQLFDYENPPDKHRTAILNGQPNESVDARISSWTSRD